MAEWLDWLDDNASVLLNLNIFSLTHKPVDAFDNACHNFYHSSHHLASTHYLPLHALLVCLTPRRDYHPLAVTDIA